MLVRIGLENNLEARSLAWAFDHPGCFSYGHDGPSAVVGMAQALTDYIAWLEAHTPTPWFNPPEIDIRLEEVWDDFHMTADYRKSKEGERSIQSWFLNDWKPLTQEDVDHGLLLLEWSRAELLEAFAAFPQDKLDAEYPGEKKTPRGILAHVATSNWYLLDRLDLAETPRSELPRDVDERLHTQHARLLQVLPSLVGLEKVLGKDGEFWSPRKLLRRAIWHERDHAAHLRRLAGQKTR